MEDMRITGVESTDLFTGSSDSSGAAGAGQSGRPLQVVRVTVEATSAAEAGEAAARLRVMGAGADTLRPFGITLGEPGDSRTGEVSVAVTGAPGTEVPVTVIAEAAAARTEHAATVTVAEPGWTMWMASHFHYDPVWWSTQGQYTEARLVLPDDDGTLPDTRTAFDLVRLHLEKARRDPGYKFVLAELDYLKPHFDAFPRDWPRSPTCCGPGGLSWSAGRTTSRTPTSPARRSPSATPSTAWASSAECSAATRARRGCWTASGTTRDSPG